MKIGVMADSHDNLVMIRAALKLLEAEGAQALLHAGDIVAPFAVKAILTFPHRVVGVFGNNDGERAGLRALWPEVSDPPYALSLGNRTVLIVHDRGKLAPGALKGVDILVCGHSHKPEVTLEDGVLCVNPGECGGWVTGAATVAVMDTDAMAARILKVGEQRS